MGIWTFFRIQFFEWPFHRMTFYSKKNLPNLIFRRTIFQNNHLLTENNFSESIVPPDIFQNLIFRITIFQNNLLTEISFPEFTIF